MAGVTKINWLGKIVIEMVGLKLQNPAHFL